MSSEKKQKKVTTAQQEILCDYFEENPEVIRGYKKKPNCIEAVQAKWKKVAIRLNVLGPPRTHKAWAKYLCDLKAKLKRKRIKWKQRSDGSGPLICNADEFSEIGLRMLQVLRKDGFNKAAEAPPDSGEEDTIFNENNDLEDTDSDTPILPQKVNRAEEIPLPNSPRTVVLTSSLSQSPGRIFVNQNDVNDEFDTFGRNVAQQLRSLPLAVALGTQEMLLAVLRKQRLKVLSESQESYSDPLYKHESI